MMEIGDCKADDEDKLEEKIMQNEVAVKVSTSENAVGVGGYEVNVDGKSRDEENLEEITGELLNKDIAEVKLDERKKVQIG